MSPWRPSPDTAHVDLVALHVAAGVRRQSAKVSAHATATGVPIATVFLETIIESPALLLENMLAKAIAII